MTLSLYLKLTFSVLYQSLRQPKVPEERITDRGFALIIRMNAIEGSKHLIRIKDFYPSFTNDV